MSTAHGIVLADEHTFIREYVRNLLMTEPGLRVMGEVADGLALLQIMDHTRELPEVVLSAIAMPEVGGLEATRRIKAEHPNVKIIILTVYREQEYLEEALSAGVEGYVLKEDIDSELLTAISEVLAGRKYLSQYFRTLK